MSRKTTYTCDNCKKPIEPYMNMINGTYHGDHVGQDRPEHTLTFVRPRKNDKPDLCKECLIKEILDYLERY